MAVYGGFAGGEISLGQRDWTTNVTTLSGDIDGDGLVNSGNSYHVVKGANNATIDGFTITKGNASVTGNTNGGGIYISGTSPTVQNCTIKDNKSTTNGGGIYVANDCFVTIGASCQINSNSAAYGGGIYFSQGGNPSGYAIVTGCAISGNQASNYGGGVYVDEPAKPHFINTVFTNNHANSSGGGMFVQEHGSQWGPIDSVNVDHCSFNGNTACYGGGFYVGGYSVPFLTNCKFGNNQASVVGGAIYYHYSGITVINSAFWSNSALRGGGLWGKGVFHQSISEPGVIIHRAKVINSTFYSNSATNGNGGAIYFDYWNTDGYDGQPSPAPLIANCILWNDSSTNIYSKEIGLGCSSKPEVRHCFIERLATGFPTHKSKIGINPNFVNSSDSQNNGLQLQLTSQCIDWGENSTLPSGINTDIIGNNRKVDISNVPDVDEGTTPIVDIGAYEYQN